MSLVKGFPRKAKTAICQVTYQFIEELLQLPANHRIVEVFQDPEVWGSHSFYIRINGPLMPETPEGVVSKRVLPAYNTLERRIDWENAEFMDLDG